MIAVPRHFLKKHFFGSINVKKHISSIPIRFDFNFCSISGCTNPLLTGKPIHYPYPNRAAEIPVGFPRTLPFISIIDKNFNHHSFSTHSSPDDEEGVGGDFLDQILARVENAPTSSYEISDFYVQELCKASNLSAASRLLESLREKHIFLSHKAYNTLLLAASERGELELSCQIFKDFLMAYKSLRSTYYVNLAKMFAKTNDSVLLHRFVREISEMTFPSSEAVNKIIFSFSECREIEKALVIFDQMKSFECKPDLFTYNIVLDMLGRSGRVDEMLNEFASMKGIGIQPDVVSYNTLLNNLRKVGRLELCLIYFKEMGEKGVKPDLLTYTALIDCLGRTGNIEESLRLFKEMKLKHIRPSIYIYHSLIDTSKKMGKIELAMAFAEEMNSCDPSLLAGPMDFKRKRR